jgi:hypothetical protein
LGWKRAIGQLEGLAEAMSGEVNSQDVHAVGVATLTIRAKKTAKEFVHFLPNLQSHQTTPFAEL